MRILQKQKFFLWLPAILIMATIFLVSSTPDYDLPSFGLVDILVKKGGHFLGYFLLTLAYLRGLGEGTKQAEPLALVFTLLYAISDEYHQSFVPERFPAITDVLIDMAGAGLAVWLENYYSPLKRLIHGGASLSTDK